MKNLKIGKKLFVVFVSIIILFTLTIFMAISSLINTSEKFTNFYTSPYEVTNRASDMKASIQSAVKNLGYATMTSDADKTAEFIKSSQNDIQGLKDGSAFLRERFQGSAELIDQFEATLEAVKSKRDQVYDLALANRNNEATELWFSQVQPAYIEALDILTQINDLSSQNANNYFQDSMKQKNLTLAALIVISILTLGVTIFLALYITKSLTNPIKELEQVAKKVSQGQLKTDITYQSKDELGSLSDSMRELTNGFRNIIYDIQYIMDELASGNFLVTSKNLDYYSGDYQEIVEAMRNLRNKMNDTLLQINTTSNEVAAGSDQVSDGAQALSQGATEQASSIEELAATITEISNQVKQNAENAREASDKTNTVGEEAAESNNRMQDMLTAMSNIDSSANEISKIIKTIEDIAFQTNILALNAAVEAARAGTAGKGFAVVADEVRNLASKSAEASKNTAVLIEGALQAVSNGTQIADETAQSLSSVVNGVRDITSTINEISRASEAQADGINQVTQGIDQISGVVQTNSATAEESAAASEELSGQAQVLKSLVGQFRLKTENF